jgi:RNA polymerase sigma-70 factor (ECF subfamily)
MRTAETACDELDDLALAKRIGHGDRAAFELMMRRHNRRLFRLARATLGNDAEAEDALQDAYLRAYRSIEGFRGDAALSTWLSRLVLNECFDRRRRTQRRENVIPLISAEDDMASVREVADDSAVPDKALGQLQLRAILERKVSELPEAFRVVFVLRSVEEMGIEEIARMLDIPEETVRSRHFRARSLLRESLARDADMAERDLFEFAGARCDRIVAKVLAGVGTMACRPRESGDPSDGFPLSRE